MRLQKNQIIEASISETNMLGFGICKVEGVVIFVQNGVEGDRVKLRIIKCAKNYYVAKIEEILTPSKHRVEPCCPYYRRCGGCSFQHINYKHEKVLKRTFVENCLKRAGLSDVEVLPLLTTEVISGYRNKGQFPVSRSSDGKVFSGFYSTKTHVVCPVERCDIQDPAFSEITQFVCNYLTEHSVEPYSEVTRKGLVRHIFLRSGAATGEIMLCLVLKNDAFPDEDAFAKEVVDSFPNIKSISFNIQPENSNVILGKKTRTVYGAEKIEDLLCGRKLKISPLSFYQVNHDAAELLYRTAFEMANLSKHDHVLDLYCGIGSISLAASCGSSVSGVEIIPEAVRDANENAKLNGITNASFYCGDAKDAFRIIKDQNAQNPLLILDPPRRGLHSDLIRDIAEHKIKNLLYISCGPDTFARDLAKFHEFGYQIGSVRPVDLFPRTSHVETVALLSRKITSK